MSFKNTTSRQHLLLHRRRSPTRFLLGMTALAVSSAMSAAHPYPFLGNKTPYVVQQSLDQPAQVPVACKPVHVEGIYRHGSRFLTRTKHLKRFDKAFGKAEGKKGLTPAGHKMLASFRLRSPLWEEKIGQLTAQGQKELFDLGVRVHTQLAPFFASTSGQIVLRSTCRDRTIQSRDHFRSGFESVLGKDKGRIAVATNEGCTDYELLFFETCDTYRKYLEDGHRKGTIRAFEDVEGNINTRNTMLAQLFTREYLDASASHDLWKIFLDVYKLCQLEFNIDKDGPKQFCGVFSPEALRVAEHREILKNFSEAGPTQSSSQVGAEIRVKGAAPTLLSFLSSMDRALRSRSDVVATFRFAHSETLQSFFSLLGLFDPGRELGPNAGDAQLWQVADITPLAANLQWVLYRCEIESRMDFKVALLHNEHSLPFPIPACKGDSLCPWDQVRGFYQERLRQLGVESQNKWHQLCGNTIGAKKDCSNDRTNF